MPTFQQIVISRQALTKSGGDMAGHKIKAVMWLKNGGVLFELNSEEATT